MSVFDVNVVHLKGNVLVLDSTIVSVLPAESFALVRLILTHQKKQKRLKEDKV